MYEACRLWEQLWTPDRLVLQVALAGVKNVRRSCQQPFNCQVIIPNDSVNCRFGRHALWSGTCDCIEQSH